MNLTYRFTRAYTLVLFLCLCIFSVVLYVGLEKSEVQSHIGNLKLLNQRIIKDLKRNPEKTLKTHHPYSSITAVSSEPETLNQVHENQVWNNTLQTNNKAVTVTDYVQTGQKWYKISSTNTIQIVENKYFLGIIMVHAWIFVFLIIMMIIVSELVSNRILQPFNKALKLIINFDIGSSQPLNFLPTKTTEFRILNNFLEKMTERSRKDYKELKEFTENASHELQTPLASMKAKIELLLESSMDENQLKNISSINDELERLSSINRSLVLLMKLDALEPDNRIQTDLSKLLKESIEYFEDLIQIRDIKLHIDIEENVHIGMEESLVVILLNNLISNAKKHNVDNGGKIDIKLSREKLEISNTGNNPEYPTEELFDRFKRGNKKQNSIGIGLSLVKKILSVHQYQFAYHYNDGWHKVTILLKV